MNPKTVKTAGQAAVILLVIGLLAASPPLRFGLFALAAFCAFFPAVFTAGKWRIAGVAIGIVALVLAAVEFPEASAHMQKYRQRAKPQAAVTRLVQKQPSACVATTHAEA